MKSDFDLHVHLYGVLSADDIWELGKDIWLQRKERLQWFATEYFKSWGSKPQWEKYWTAENGKDLLKKDYLFTTKNSFSHFQACFNLIIALFPIVSTDKKMVYFLLKKMIKAKENYYETRIVFPFYYKDNEILEYLTTVTSAIQDKDLNVRVIVSLTRENKIYLNQYKLIKQWQNKNPDLKKFLVGIDFAADEETESSDQKIFFIKQVTIDNSKNPENSLIISCHVGESFKKCGLVSACKKIFSASVFGCHRLANTIALGKSLQDLSGTSFTEESYSRKSTLNWALSTNPPSKVANYIKKSLQKISTDTTITVNYSLEEENLGEHIQNFVCNKIKEKKTILEVCPTSNYLIGEVSSYKKHPLHKFICEGLNVCICSDDPGIFSTSLAAEFDFCINKLKIPISALEKIRQQTLYYQACKIL
jgi:hypothetical protein